MAPGNAAVTGKLFVSDGIRLRDALGSPFVSKVSGESWRSCDDACQSATQLTRNQRQQEPSTKYRSIALILRSPVRGIAVGRHNFEVFTGADHMAHSLFTWKFRRHGLDGATERFCHRLPLNMEPAKEPAFHPHSLFILDELLAIMQEDKTL